MYWANLAIALNIIHSARKFGTVELINLGFSCVYPKLAPKPLKEEYLLSGPLESTNEAYAVAKIAAIKLCSQGIFSDRVVPWGMSTPFREFLHVDDLAEACFFLMKATDSLRISVLRDRLAMIHPNPTVRQKNCWIYPKYLYLAGSQKLL